MEAISTKLNGMVLPNSNSQLEEICKSDEQDICNVKSKDICDTNTTKEMNADCTSNLAQHPHLTPPSVNTVLVTANVGSVFEDTKRLMPIWLDQFDAFLERTRPEFVALHCQEVYYKYFYLNSLQQKVQLRNDYMAEKQLRRNKILIDIFTLQIGGKFASGQNEYVKTFSESIKEIGNKLGYTKMVAFFDEDFECEEK